MASLLFVAPADLGETVLATGAVDYALAGLDAPEATIVCDPAAANLFRALPNATLHPAGEGFAAWLAMAWQVGRMPFDLALDFSGAPASYAIRAKHLVARRQPHVLQHLVEDFTALMGVERTLAPKLWLDDAARASAGLIAPDAEGLLVIAPGGLTASKRWAPERFAAVARRLVGGPLANAGVVVLGAAARDAEVTQRIVSSLDADGVAARDLGQAPDLLFAAALLERATLCFGNDNALTHIAAAVGAPTLTLFGPTDERVRAPYGPRTRTLRGRDLEAVALDEARAMEDVSVDAVEAAALDLLHAGGLR